MAQRCQAIGCTEPNPKAIAQTRFGTVEMCYNCQQEHCNGARV